MNIKIQIEKGIPIPTASLVNNLENETPIGELEIGESFVYPTKALNKSEHSVRGRVSVYSKKTNKTFTTRIQEDGLRVWRIK